MRERNQMIFEMHESGTSNAEIGRRIGLGRERVRQIIERAKREQEVKKLAEENPIFLLSTRARNVLSRRKIHSIDQLKGVTRESLLNISACGDATADEIIKLRNNNLR